ncbi:MAG: M1 family metallopeptidase [Phototrophicaceae bacterium]
MITMMLSLLVTVNCACAQDVSALGVMGASGVGDPYFPSLGNGGYDAQHYLLDIIPDMDAQTINARVTMTAFAMESLIRFNLDFIGFEIESVTVAGELAEFSREERELIISPATQIEQSTLFDVTIVYRGTPGQGIGFDNLPFARGWNWIADGSYVASEPDGASLWFPVNDHPSDKATYSIHVTVPQDYTVVANGFLQDVVLNSDLQTFIWETDELTASYLVTINIGRFVREDADGLPETPIRNYYPLDSIIDGARTFSDQDEMMHFFNGHFGEYPFDVYGSVVVDEALPFALETQTISLYGTNILRDDPSSPIIVAHELAHSWFGNSVSVKTWRDIWLNEGFATYSSMLWLAESTNQSVMESVMRQQFEAIEDSGVVIADPGAENLFAPTVYWGGAWVLMSLHERVGDDVFFEILEVYHTRYADSVAETADFIAVAEEVSAEDLSDFFDTWLYTENRPS